MNSMDNTVVNNSEVNSSDIAIERTKKICKKLSRIRLAFVIVVGVLFVTSLVVEVIIAIFLHFWSILLNPIVFWIFFAIETPFLIAIIVFSIIIAIKRKKYGLIVRRKDMNFSSLESLDYIDRLCRDADFELNNKRRRRRQLPMFVGFIIVAVLLIIGIVVAYIMLAKMGTTAGLSAAGISSALKAIGGNMMGGIYVLGLMIALPPIVAGCIFFGIRELRFRVEKDALYKEAIKKQDAIIKALEEKSSSDSKKMERLKELNIVLTRTIRELNKDRGIDGEKEG